MNVRAGVPARRCILCSFHVHPHPCHYGFSFLGWLSSLQHFLCLDYECTKVALSSLAKKTPAVRRQAPCVPATSNTFSPRGSNTVSPSHPVGWRTQALGMTQQGATLQNYNNELVKCERSPTSQIMPTPTADMYSDADTQASKTSVKSERR